MIRKEVGVELIDFNGILGISQKQMVNYTWRWGIVQMETHLLPLLVRITMKRMWRILTPIGFILDASRKHIYVCVFHPRNILYIHTSP